MMGLQVPLGLDALALLLEVVQQLVVVLVEDHAGDAVQPRHDVTGSRGVLPALQPRPELACACTAPLHRLGACASLWLCTWAIASSIPQPNSKLTGACRALLHSLGACAALWLSAWPQHKTFPLKAASLHPALATCHNRVSTEGIPGELLEWTSSVRYETSSG